MERWQNKVAVVTGASSGIGEAIAKDLIKAGVQVVGLARHKEGLDKFRESLDEKHCRLFTGTQCDVSDLKAVNETFDEIILNLGGVDILVNNAGIFIEGLLVETDPQQIEYMWSIAVMGVVYCTQRAFWSMKAHNVNAHVIMINSITGHSPVCGVPSDKPLTHLNLCSPSKYPVTAMTEIFRQEFFESGTAVKITSISPGLVDTNMPKLQLRETMRNWILSPEDVSNAVMFCLSTPLHVQISELTIRPIGL